MVIAFTPGLPTTSQPGYAPGSSPGFDGGGFLPNVLPGLQLWLDAADSVTITEDSGAVSQWDDKSGNSNNVTQGTEANQPTTNATTQNGNNVIDFDGSDGFDVPSGLFTVADGANTVFVVSKRTSEDASLDGLFNFRTSTTNKFTMFYFTSSGVINFRSNNTAAGTVSNTGNTNTNFNIIRGRRSGTTQALAVNGGSETTNANGSDISGVDNAFIGSIDGTLQFLTGSIAEMTMYNRSLSVAERASVEAYLSNKWGISI